MEPSSAEDGDQTRRPVYGAAPSLLQWSRPQLRTETRVVGWRETPKRRASMEPSSAEDGDLMCGQVHVVKHAASMEPSSAEDGDKLLILRALRLLPSFNGAVLS